MDHTKFSRNVTFQHTVTCLDITDFFIENDVSQKVKIKNIAIDVKQAARRIKYT
jgi:hypothetical protein